MIVKFSSTNASTTMEAIHKFEKQLGFLLPEDYKLFLVETNGGKLNQCTYEYINRKVGKTVIGIDEFFGLDTKNIALPFIPDTSLSIVRSHMASMVPQELLVIADVMGNAVVTLSMDSDDLGKIFLWDSGMPSYEFAHILANSFSEFLDNIKCETD